MCRSIKILFNFKPSASEKEIEEASLQFVRKISGFRKPSQVNEVTFNQAVADISVVVRKMVDSLVTDAQPRNREVEVQRARIKAAQRFGARQAL